MAKRFVETCDYCKQEAELSGSIEIKKGKKKGRAYELCMTCAEELEQRLVATELSLPRKKAQASREIENPEEDDDTLTLDDGSTKDIPERDNDEQEEENDPPLHRNLPKGVDKNGNDCIHLNRNPPRLSAKTKKITYFCRDCGKNLPYMSAKEKAEALSGKLPAGTRLTEHKSNERKGRD